MCVALARQFRRSYMPYVYIVSYLVMRTSSTTCRQNMRVSGVLLFFVVMSYDFRQLANTGEKNIGGVFLSSFFRKGIHQEETVGMIFQMLLLWVFFASPDDAPLHISLMQNMIPVIESYLCDSSTTRPPNNNGKEAIEQNEKRKTPTTRQQQ